MNLTKEELETIKSLIAVTESIKESYDKLINLEIAGKKETDEYKRCLDSLKISINLEKSIYEKIAIDKCETFLQYLHLNENNHTLKEEEAIFDKDKNLILSRIMIKLKRKIIGDVNYVKSAILPLEVESFLSQFKGEIKRSMEYAIKIGPVILNDIFNCFLAIIKKSDNKENIKSKFYTSFIIENIENEMLSNSFNVEDNPYLTASFLTNLYGIPDNTLKKILIYQIVSYYNNTLNTILFNEDKDLECSEVKDNISVRLSFLRALLIFLDDDIIMDMNAQFHDMIEDEKNSSIFNTREEIIEMILNSFKKVKKDRSIPKIISLKL